MTQEDKELLFQDLCCRLPYGVKVSIQDITGKYRTITERVFDTYAIQFINNNNILIKPYLRPMSSMTEEEKKEVCSLNGISLIELNERVKWKNMYIKAYTIETFDYFNTKHLDYRGLIEKGLALEAPKGMYK